MRFYRQIDQIKAMTFDLDDTLYDNRPVIRRVEQAMVAWLYQHHPISATESISWWSDLKQRVASDNPWLLNDVTQWRFTQIEQGLSLLGYDAERAQQAANEAIQEVHRLRSDFTVPAESHRVLTALSQAIPLVAITNGNVDLERIGLDQYFSLILKAGPNGYAKPHHDMFDQARQYLGLEADQILHVGDHLVSDVQGAVNSGYKACWFNDQEVSVRQSSRARVLPDVEISYLKQLLDLIE